MKNDRLSKIVAKGKWHYILIHGVCFWGISGAVFVVAIEFIFNKGVSKADVVFPFVTFPPAGILWGAFMWTFFKKRVDATVAGTGNEGA